MSETEKTAQPNSSGAPAAADDDRSWAATVSSLRALVGAHPVAAAAIGACCAATPAFGAGVGRGLHACGYVLACAVGIVLVRRFARRADPVPVPRPGREAGVLAAFAGLGLLAFVAVNAERFGGEAPVGLVRAALFVAVLVLIFPVAGTVYLWRRGSPPSAQGLRPRSVGVSFLLVAVVAGAAVVFAPDRLETNLREIGAMFGPGLVVGILLQVVSEELLRFQHQTRFGAALRSRPAGWLLAALVWGLLHVPRYYRDDPLLAAAGVVTLVPLGLLWGYTSDRTSSLWPSAVAHALNVWGLQSF